MQLQKGKRYEAILSLTGLEAIAPNSAVASKFVELGFINVNATGTGSSRTVTGMWPGSSKNVDLPKQVKSAKEIL